MEPYTFPYYSFPIPPSDPFPNGQLALRPMLMARVQSGWWAAPLLCIARLDSGADYCAFPLSFAALLGLNLTQVKKDVAGTVGNAHNETYFADLLIEIPVARNEHPISFRAYAAFTAGLDAEGIGILGQSNFFESFPVMFNRTEKVFTIWALGQVKPTPGAA